MRDLSGPAAATGTSVDEADLDAAVCELRERLSEAKRNGSGVPRLLIDHAIEVVLAALDEQRRELVRLRAQVVSLTAEHSGACDDLAPCQRCADRDELTGLRAMQQRAQTIATWNGQRRAGGCARHPREGVDMTGFEFRIEYTIQRRAVDGEGDFVDVGFGSSGAWDDVNAAAFAMESYIQNRQWETEGDMPDPDEVEGSA